MAWDRSIHGRFRQMFSKKEKKAEGRYKRMLGGAGCPMEKNVVQNAPYIASFVFRQKCSEEEGTTHRETE